MSSPVKIEIPKSLYKPREIEIEGKIFKVKRLMRDILEEIEILDDEVKNGKLSAAYKRLEILLGKSPALDKILNKLDFYQLDNISGSVIRAALVPEEKEKNEPGPGDEKSPS